jgi:hypothetical protein
MRNDARPIGEANPLEAADAQHPDSAPTSGPSAHDARESVTHDRQSSIVNQGAADNARRDDADVDPVMPTGDSTLKTNI